MTERQFVPWPKIPRFNRGMTVTEKIDGTNACIVIGPTDGSAGPGAPRDVYAQSRTRIITPEADNYGFALWVQQNRDSLIADLGEGRHFGEWWGRGIQRGYGLDHRRFSLFNTAKWSGDVANFETVGLDVVPVLYEGTFSQDMVDECVLRLHAHGSFTGGSGKPEGVVVFHHAAGQMFKILLEGDNHPKGEAA